MSVGTYSSDGPTCPDCGRVFTPDEAHYFDETGYTEDECDQCGCKFSVAVHHSVSWECLPIATGRKDAVR